jgi:hypothetical protein
MLSTIGKSALRRAGLQACQLTKGRVAELTSKLQRVSITDNARTVTQPFESGRFAAVRSFATTSTEADTAATPKPKATGTRKSTTGATKKAAKKTSKKTTTKKASMKAKKPAKTPLTEEQKQEKVAKRVAAKAKNDLKKLKTDALLKEPAQLPATAWTVLLTEYTQTQKSNATEKFGGIKESVTGAAAKYKGLSASEREHYNHIANQNKEKNEEAYRKWVEQHTPDQIRIANNARQALARKDKAGSRKFSAINDTRLPKRPINARAAFTKERHASGDLHGIAFQDAAKRIHDEWNALSASEKKVTYPSYQQAIHFANMMQHYEDVAEQDKARYGQEYKSAFGHDAPFLAAKSAPAA